MEEIIFKEFKNRKPDSWKNKKPDSWYNDFYDKLLDFPSPYFNWDFKERIQIVINYDKIIDNNKFMEELKYDISGRKEFINQYNTFQKNKELLIIYEQNQLSFELKAENEDEEDFSKFTKELIKKCFSILKQGYLITNQLFLLGKWFEDDVDFGLIYYDY